MQYQDREEKKGSQNRQIKRFLRLMALNQHRIYGFTLSLVAREADADDIMQEVSLTMWEKFDQFEQGTDFSAWGMKIARYKIMNYRQKRYGKNQPVYLSDEAVQVLGGVSEKVMHHIDQRIDAVKKCVKKLHSRERNIVRLRYDEELPVKVIADRLGKKPLTVYRVLAHIHDSLLRCVRLTLASG